MIVIVFKSNATKRIVSKELLDRSYDVCHSDQVAVIGKTYLKLQDMFTQLH